MNLGFDPVPVLGHLHRQNDLGGLISDLPSREGCPGKYRSSTECGEFFPLLYWSANLGMSVLFWIRQALGIKKFVSDIRG